jgi:hypothetical protein
MVRSCDGEVNSKPWSDQVVARFARFAGRFERAVPGVFPRQLQT